MTAIKSDSKTQSKSNTTPTPLADQLPKYIDMDKWDNAPETLVTWQGNVPLAAMPRLASLKDNQHSNDASDTTNQASNKDSKIKVAVEFSQKNGVIWAQLHTEGQVWQTCQRCLEPVAVSLNYDNTLALLQDDSETGLVDEAADFLLLDELEHEKGSDKKLLLLPLLEDELLVQLPLSPKHDDCELLVTQVGDEIEEIQENPFAMLATLKGKLPS